MKKYCYNCKIKDCDIRDEINFCEDCAEYKDCTICYEYCKKGHAIECNNGFELDEYSDPYDEYDEDFDFNLEYEDEEEKNG